jgi:putative membrane protein
MTVQAQLSEARKPLSSDEMALERTLMASERTLLAWVRTAMSFISFGFTMIKVLQTLALTLASKVPGMEGDNVGIMLMAFGTGPLAVGMFQYYKMALKLGKTPREALMNSSFGLAIVVLLLGALLFLNAVFKWHLM